ncbi:hypothetical protein BDV29DRAFT_162660 [Aspergillus leporis]|uniref:GPI anchored serine-threonine rich protein n=1 Tax=Aspergillus leporis TaxID=41062 RepID=A0A5N5WIM1_9EURO|nr:hypothetical protein BDV29DRAFT_162660 [Aspergillus leporis]
MHRTVTSIFLAACVPLLVAAQATQTPAAVPGTIYSIKPCDAQNIVDKCLELMREQLKTCGPNEWSCLCEQSGNVATCYKNCPPSDESVAEDRNVKTFCDAAKALPSSSSKVATTSTPAASAAAKKTSTSTTTGSSSTSKGAAALPTAAFGTVEGGLILGVMLGVLGV